MTVTPGSAAAAGARAGPPHVAGQPRRADASRRRGARHLVAARDGPRTTAELAAATGTHEDSLGRLLRALAGLGPARLPRAGMGAHTARRRGRRPRRRPAMVRAGGRRARIDADRDRAPCDDVLHGCTAFEYLARHPDDAAEFDALMTLTNAGEPEAVAEAYDFAAARRVVDVGGGNGTLLAEVLRRSPKLEGVLFDVPETAARAVPELGALADRCEIVAGDFFQTVPAGADAYLLSHVLHDCGRTAGAGDPRTRPRSDRARRKARRGRERRCRATTPRIPPGWST